MTIDDAKHGWRGTGRRLAGHRRSHHATSLDCSNSLQLWQGLFAEGFVAETCSTPSTAAFRLRALATTSAGGGDYLVAARTDEQGELHLFVYDENYHGWF
jgi:hypothetical protein